MGKPKALDKATLTAKDATHILKEGYKKQIRETQDRYGSGDNPADKPGRTVENLAEKGAGHVKNTALKGGKYLVKNIRMNRKKEPVSQSGKGKQPPTPAGQRQLAAQNAKRKLQLKRGNDLKTKRQRVQKAAENHRVNSQLSSAPKTPEAMQSAPGNRISSAPKTPEAVRKQAVRSVPRNPQQVAASQPTPGKQAVKQRQTVGKAAPKVKQKQADTIHRMKKQGVQKAKKVEAKTRKTVQKTARKQATRKARQAAQRETVKRSIQTMKAATKFIIRMVKLVVKAAAALVKALVAAAGPVAAIIVLVVIVGVVAALIASPFGVFFSDQDTTPDTTPIAEVAQELDQQFNVRIEEIKQAHSYVDSVEMHFTGTPDSVNHWYDILAIFAVKTALDEQDGMDVVTIDPARIDLIRAVFWDMKLIDYDVETIHHHDSSEDGDCWDEYILHIYITIKGASQQAEDYGFTDDQKDIARELLSGAYDEYFAALLAGTGQDGGGSEVITIVEEGIYIWPSPVSQQITSYFGNRPNPTTGVPDNHTGIDIAAGYGTPVLAAADGTVITAAFDADGYGIYAIIDHGEGNHTLYGHMSSRNVNVGDTVTQGETIGLVGSTGWSTGNHIHFETLVNGTRADPLLYYSGFD